MLLIFHNYMNYFIDSIPNSTSLRIFALKFSISFEILFHCRSWRALNWVIIHSRHLEILGLETTNMSCLFFWVSSKALWVKIVWNPWAKTSFPRAREWVSEQANEWAQWSAQAKQANVWVVQANEQKYEQVAQRLLWDSWWFCTIVQKSFFEWFSCQKRDEVPFGISFNGRL